MPSVRFTPVSTPPRRLAFVPALAGLGFAAALTAGLLVAFGALNSEALVARGFERAFASLDMPLPLTGHPYDGIAGSEDYWLRSNANVGLIKAAAVGQNIKFGDHGVERNLIIIDIRDGGDAVTHIDTADGSERVLLITCRDTRLPAAGIVLLRLEAGRIIEIAADATANAL